MGMPITVEVIDKQVTDEIIEKIFDYFRSVDERFSTYKDTSEITKINRGEIKQTKYSPQMREIFALSEKTKQETNGYFDIMHHGKYDPSGIVKGWAIQHAAQMLQQQGFKNYYVEAGGDIQVAGKNKAGKRWQVGIRNPFNREEIVKVVALSDNAIATSGTYIRGQHVYNPHSKDKQITDIISLTVIGKNILDADRFATAAFAMGKQGIKFIESLRGFAGYAIDREGIATMTTGFEQYCIN